MTSDTSVKLHYFLRANGSMGFFLHFSMNKSEIFAFQTPESDISLDFTADNSAFGSTPCRTHEITLCTADESVVHHEVDDNVSFVM